MIRDTRSTPSAPFISLTDRSSSVWQRRPTPLKNWSRAGLRSVMTHNRRRRDAQTSAEKQKGLHRGGPKYLWLTEAPVGIEPTNGGFADLCLTTWLRRRMLWANNLARVSHQPQVRMLLSVQCPK